MLVKSPLPPDQLKELERLTEIKGAYKEPETITPKEIIKAPETPAIETKKENTIVVNGIEKEIFIRKKRQYRAFIKMVKQGKVTSALVAARILGVSHLTIREWLQTKKVMEAMENDVASYVEKIQVSKDWKAQAYLLDKLQGSKEEEEKQQDLKQLIVINT